MSQGWIKLHRSMLEWEWYTEPNTFRMFMHLLIVANHEPKKWRGITIGRGQRLTSLSHLATETGLSAQSVRTSINRLKSTGEITSEATSKFTMITLCNYGTYQAKETEANKATNKPSNNPATNDQQAPNNKQEPKNIRIKENKNIPTTAAGDAEEAVYLTKKKRKLQGKRLETFERFWNAFNYRKDKASAADAWCDIPELRDTLVDQIVASATREADGRAAMIAQRKSPKYAQGWITARRWEDEESPQSSTRTVPKPAQSPEPKNWRKAMEHHFEAAPAQLKHFKDGKKNQTWSGLGENVQKKLTAIIKEKNL
mgnify:CR=1 FL=1